MNRLHSHIPMLGLAAAASLALVGCGEDNNTTCGNGTVLQGDMCVPSSTTTCGTGTVLTAGGFEPVPLDADTMPGPVFKALASKESGPPPPKLDHAALEALIAREAGMSLPARNPKR